MTDNNNTPLVTVAMVTYNSEKYVRMAIESVLASSYTNFELIISDDCSTDNTWEIIQEYKDPRIRAYQNEINLREYPNRNRCIDLARGEYFIFIDGDDYIYPHGLENFIKWTSLDKSAAMVISRPDTDHIIYPYVLLPEQAFKYDYLGKSITSQGFPSTLFKTQVLQNIKLRCDYISGDTYLKKEIAYQYNSILIYNGLAWWRKTPGQASEKAIKSKEGFIQMVTMNLYFLEKHKSILTIKEIDNAHTRLYKPICKKIVKNLLKLKIGDVVTIIKNSKISLKHILCLFKKAPKDYQLGDSVNPLTTIHEFK